MNNTETAIKEHKDELLTLLHRRITSEEWIGLLYPMTSQLRFLVQAERLVKHPETYGDHFSKGLLTSASSEPINGVRLNQQAQDTREILKIISSTMVPRYVTNELLELPYWQGVQTALSLVSRADHHLEDFLTSNNERAAIEAVLEGSEAASAKFKELEDRIRHLTTEQSCSINEELTAILAVRDLEWVLGCHSRPLTQRSYQHVMTDSDLSRVGWLKETISEKGSSMETFLTAVTWRRSPRLLAEVSEARMDKALANVVGSITMIHESRLRVYQALVAKTIGWAKPILAIRHKSGDKMIVVGRFGMLDKKRLNDLTQFGMPPMSLESVLFLPYKLRLSKPYVVIELD